MLVLEIAGEQYVPLRAIPFITGGFFSVPWIISMLLDPEGSRNTECIVTAYRTDGQQGFLKIYPSSLKRHLKATPRQATEAFSGEATIDQLKRLPPAAYVRRDQLYACFEAELAHAQADSDHPDLRLGGPFQWDEHPMLDDDLRSAILEGTATDAKHPPARPKEDSQTAELRRTVETIVKQFAKRGCDLCLSPLDITTSRMRELVEKQNPQLSAAMGDKAIRRALIFIGVKGGPGAKKSAPPADRIAQEILHEK